MTLDLEGEVRLGERALAAGAAARERVGSGGPSQRTLKSNSLGTLDCALRGGLETEAQSLVAKGWRSPGTRFRSLQGFIAGGVSPAGLSACSLPDRSTWSVAQ